MGYYEIKSQHGKGGMGEVHQAGDRKLGREVAIKVLPEEFAGDANIRYASGDSTKLLDSLSTSRSSYRQKYKAALARAFYRLNPRIFIE